MGDTPRELLRILVECESGPCSTDHHGNCQDHPCGEADGGCLVARAKALLDDETQQLVGDQLLPQRIVTREDAIARATAIVNGKWSMHHNVMLQTETSADSRPQTLTNIAEADAADVKALVALAGVLPTEAEMAMRGSGF